MLDPMKEVAVSTLRRILFATDFSPASRRAFEEAISLSRQNDAELVLAHVYRTPGTLPAEMALTPDTVEQVDAKLSEAAGTRLRALLEEAGRARVRGRILLLSGAPDEAIVEAARETGADIEYTKQLEKMVTAKSKGITYKTEEKEDLVDTSNNLLEALKASVQRSKTVKN